jgi:hypothetical protein
MQQRLHHHSEATQGSAEQHASGGAKQEREADWLDILPRNEMTEEVWCEPTRDKPEQASHDHADERGNRHDSKDSFPGHHEQFFNTATPTLLGGPLSMA